MASPGKYIEVIRAAVEEAIGCKADPVSDEMSDDAAHWFAMYQAQCTATDEFRKLAEKKSDAALTARIKELEHDLATVNRRLTHLWQIRDAFIAQCELEGKL